MTKEQLAKKTVDNSISYLLGLPQGYEYEKINEKDILQWKIKNDVLYRLWLSSLHSYGGNELFATEREQVLQDICEAYHKPEGSHIAKQAMKKIMKLSRELLQLKYKSVLGLKSVISEFKQQKKEMEVYNKILNG